MMKRLILPLLILALASCAKEHQGWSLNGEVPTDVEVVTLEKPNAMGGWYVTDSITPDATGHFRIITERANRNIYRLKVADAYIYVPADSTETLTLVVDAAGGHTLDGSHEAMLFTQVDEILASPDSLTDRRILEALQHDWDSTAAYYANLRQKGRNVKLLKAVANAYSANRPEDTRTALLLQQVAGTLPQGQAQEIMIEAPETGYFDFSLQNAKGEQVALSSVVDSHPTAILAFVELEGDASAATHLQLGTIHTSHPEVGIYEVALHPNQHQFELLTRELPWTVVYQSETSPRTHLGQYAIQGFPTLFLLQDGVITRRITNSDDLKSLTL